MLAFLEKIFGAILGIFVILCLLAVPLTVLFDAIDRRKNGGCN